MRFHLLHESFKSENIGIHTCSLSARSDVRWLSLLVTTCNFLCLLVLLVQQLLQQATRIHNPIQPTMERIVRVTWPLVQPSPMHMNKKLKLFLASIVETRSTHMLKVIDNIDTVMMIQVILMWKSFWLKQSCIKSLTKQITIV